MTRKAMILMALVLVAATAATAATALAGPRRHSDAVISRHCQVERADDFARGSCGPSVAGQVAGAQANLSDAMLILKLKHPPGPLRRGPTTFVPRQ